MKLEEAVECVYDVHIQFYATLKIVVEVDERLNIDKHIVVGT